MSERDGWNHLYLYDVKTGQVKNQVTKGEWVVRGVERVDREKRQILFRAGDTKALTQVRESILGQGEPNAA